MSLDRVFNTLDVVMSKSNGLMLIRSDISA
jgi:hypothetical protein